MADTARSWRNLVAEERDFCPPQAGRQRSSNGTSTLVRTPQHVPGLNRPLRIAHFILGRCNPDSANGVDQAVYHFARTQAALGHPVAVFSLTEKPALPIPGVTVFHCSLCDCRCRSSQNEDGISELHVHHGTFRAGW